MSRKKMISFTNFNRGINNTSSYDELEPSELITAINIDLQARGGYTQRKGCSVYKTLEDVNTPISCLINYPEKPLLVTDKSLRDFNNNVITLLLKSNNIAYEFFTNSKLYLLDGEEYWVYDGTTCVPVTPAEGADLTPIKRCTRLIQRGQRMFALGDPQNPNYLYFSEIGDPTNFKASSIVKAVTDDNDKLTDLMLFSDSLLVFKEREIFRWTGWDPSTDVEFKPLDVGHGAIPGTVQVSEDYLIFADNEGVFCLNTVEDKLIKSYYVSKNIEDIYKTLTNLDKMRSIVYKGNYYLACCDNGTGKNNLVLKASLGMAYNGSTGEGVSKLLFPWVIYKGWNVADWIEGDDNELYFGSSLTGIIYKAFDGLNDVDEPIYSEATHYLKLEDAVVVKKLKKLFLIAQQDESHGCTVRLDIEAGYNTYAKEIVIDESGSWDITNWDEFVWDWVDTVIKEIKIGKKVNRIRIKISHEALDEVMTIYGFAAYYKSKKPRGSKYGISDIEIV